MNNVIKFGRENTQWQKLSGPSLSYRTKPLTSEVTFLVNNPILFLIQIFIFILKKSSLFSLFVILQGCENRVPNILQCEIHSL